MNIFKKALIAVLTVGLISVPSAMKEVEAANQPEKLYLTPNANWKKDNARFAAYFFGNGETWSSMTDDNKDGIYEVVTPTAKIYPNVIFCRMNPNASTNNWNNKWNQTADLKIPTDGTNHYTVKSGTWDKGGGTWSTFGSDTPVEPEVFEVNKEWYLRGDFNSWGTGSSYLLTAVEGKENTYTITVDLEAGKQFKIADSSWGHEFGYSQINSESKTLVTSSGTNIKTKAAGTYTFTISFNYDSSTDLYSNLSLAISFVEAEEPVVYEANKEWYLRGSMAGSDWPAKEEFKLIAVEGKENTFAITLDIEAGQEFKVADSSWTVDNFGYETVTTEGRAFVEEADGGNIKTKSAGTYTITISFSFDSSSNSYSNKSLAISFVEKIEPEVFTELETVYFSASHWDVDGAWFAAYFYNRSGENAWAKAKKLYESIYSISTPEGEWSGLIFCRMNADFDTLSWNNDTETHVWNQTNDISFESGKNHFTVNDGEWSDDTTKANGTWSLFEAPYKTFESVTAELGFTYTYTEETGDIVDVAFANVRFATPKLVTDDFDVDSYGMRISFGDKVEEFVWTEEQLVKEENNFYWSAIVMNIPKSEFNTKITVVSYVTIGEDKVDISEARETSVAELAKTYVDKAAELELTAQQVAGCQYIVDTCAA